jgi:hypothetical protein
MPQKIPPAYRRNLSSTCRRVEQSTIELEHLLLRDEPQMLTKKVTHGLPEEKRGRLLTAVRRLRRMNELMFTILQLDSSTTDEEQIVNAKIAQLWTILVDSQPQKVKGSGELTVESGEFIGEQLKRMIAELNDVLSSSPE